MISVTGCHRKLHTWQILQRANVKITLPKGEHTFFTLFLCQPCIVHLLCCMDVSQHCQEPFCQEHGGWPTNWGCRCYKQHHHFVFKEKACSVCRSVIWLLWHSPFCLCRLGIATGNPGVFPGYPYPYPSLPVPVPWGTGLAGTGHGYTVQGPCQAMIIFAGPESPDPVTLARWCKIK